LVSNGSQLQSILKNTQVSGQGARGWWGGRAPKKTLARGAGGRTRASFSMTVGISKEDSASFLKKRSKKLLVNGARAGAAPVARRRNLFLVVSHFEFPKIETR